MQTQTMNDQKTNDCQLSLWIKRPNSGSSSCSSGSGATSRRRRRRSGHLHLTLHTSSAMDEEYKKNLDVVAAAAATPTTIDEHQQNQQHQSSIQYTIEQRYMNRNILLEHALQRKLIHLKLSHDKLMVLQDAVHRLVGKQQEQMDVTTIVSTNSNKNNQWKHPTFKQSNNNNSNNNTTTTANNNNNTDNSYNTTTQHSNKTNPTKLDERVASKQQLLCFNQWDSSFIQIQIQRQKEVDLLRKEIVQQWQARSKIQQQQQMELYQQQQQQQQQQWEQERIELLTEEKALRMRLDKEVENSLYYKAKWNNSTRSSDMAHEQLQQQREQIQQLREKLIQAQQQQKEFIVQDEKDTKNRISDAIQIAQASVSAARNRELKMQQQYNELLYRHTCIRKEYQKLQHQSNLQQRTTGFRNETMIQNEIVPNVTSSNGTATILGSIQSPTSTTTTTPFTEVILKQRSEQSPIFMVRNTTTSSMVANAAAVAAAKTVTTPSSNPVSLSGTGFRFPTTIFKGISVLLQPGMLGTIIWNSYNHKKTKKRHHTKQQPNQTSNQFWKIPFVKIRTMFRKL